MTLSVRAGLAGLVGALVMSQGVAAQNLRTITASRDRGSERALNVSVTFAAGRFALHPVDGRALYREVFTYDEDKFDPEGGYDGASHALTIGLSQHHGVNASYRNGRVPQALDLGLSAYVPLSLYLKLGAAQTDLELGGMTLSSATIETGASESSIHFGAPNRMHCDHLVMHAGAAQFAAQGLGNARCSHYELKGGVGDLTLDFSGDWEADADAAGRVEMGLGALTLQFPHDLGVVIRVEKFLASFEPNGFVKRGGAYYSTNYDAATRKLTLDVSAALGDIEVKWID